MILTSLAFCSFGDTRKYLFYSPSGGDKTDKYRSDKYNFKGIDGGPVLVSLSQSHSCLSKKGEMATTILFFFLIF